MYTFVQLLYNFIVNDSRFFAQIYIFLTFIFISDKRKSLEKSRLYYGRRMGIRTPDPLIKRENYWYFFIVYFQYVIFFALCVCTGFVQVS